MKEEKRFWKMIFACLIICSVGIAFSLFIQENNQQAIAISVQSLEDATNQSAQRIDDLLERAQDELLLTADLYTEMLKEPVVTVADLQVLTEKSPFDDITFIDKNGISLNSYGETINAASRTYFQEGIKGNQGIDVVFRAENSREKENVVVFYAPLYYDGEIFGVMTGIYRESQMQALLYNTFFGADARTLLCMRDGTIIASSNVKQTAISVFDEGTFHSNLAADVVTALKAVLQEGKDYKFQYEGMNGTGNAYVTSLGEYDWMLIQTFPSQITAQIVADSNRAGMHLLAGLIGIFAVCILVLQVASFIQKRKLILENTEKSYVIDGITQLFETFILIDLEQGTYRYLANTKPRYTESPREGAYALLQKCISDIAVDEEARERLAQVLEKETLQKELSGDTSYLRYEYRVKSENEEEKWDGLHLICLARTDGVATEVLFAYQDVTRLKNQEIRSYEALRDACRAVESANQAKSRFLSSMSHDIRTPMNAIMGMTAIAAMHLDEPERVKDCLNKITVSSQHLLGLINEVLDMSKIESGKMVLAEEEFSLSSIIEDMIAMFLSQMEAKHQQFIVNVLDSIHEDVIGDKRRIQQILVNILSNAVKFTPEGGKITLDIQEAPSTMHGYGCYVFTVADTGIGMEESFLDKLFEPFTRADYAYTGKIEGTGLGMPIVKNIVQMMNGDIQVESKLHEGSKFIVTLYLKWNHFQPENMAGLENLRVLVVDDEQFACESACSILEEIGMIADWVLSGKEAITHLLDAYTAQKAYAAVILDWKMPDMDGVETARAIRACVGQDVPIVILSAYDYSSIEQEARAAGVNAFISKPLFRSRLVYVMKSLMLGEEQEQSKLTQLQEKTYVNKRVLLVEDNELNMEIAEELLTQIGIRVEKAVNGKLAVERVREMPPGYYDLILMDIQMPEMNGYEATAAIRASEREDLQTLPIVAMSADAFTDDVKCAQDVGMNGHIAKPIEIEKLLQVLDTWIG